MLKASIIEVRNLHRSIEMKSNAIHILRGLDFSVSQGEWIALTGPSGSGKSTLLGILGGVDSPSSGEVVFDGRDIAHQSEAGLAQIRNQSIGIVFQNFNLIPTMTALENIEVPLYISADAKHATERAMEMLKAVGLADRGKHLPHQLSGGEQQRIAIARALVTQPKLLLADEPTGNLDSVAGNKVLQLIGQIRERLGITVIMVTHDMEVAAYADRVLHMVDGQLVNQEPASIGA